MVLGKKKSKPHQGKEDENARLWFRSVSLEQ